MVDFLPSDFITGLRPVILSLANQIRIAELIAEGILKYNIQAFSFNVLPDHIHIVVAVTDETELSSLIGQLKGYTSFMFNKENAVKTKLWAQKFNRVLVENDNHLSNVTEYTKSNHLKHEQSWGKENLIGFSDVLDELNNKVCLSIDKTL